MVNKFFARLGKVFFAVLVAHLVGKAAAMGAMDAVRSEKKRQLAKVLTGEGRMPGNLPAELKPALLSLQEALREMREAATAEVTDKPESRVN